MYKKISFILIFSLCGVCSATRSSSSITFDTWDQNPSHQKKQSASKNSKYSQELTEHKGAGTGPAYQDPRSQVWKDKGDLVRVKVDGKEVSVHEGDISDTSGNQSQSTGVQSAKHRQQPQRTNPQYRPLQGSPRRSLTERMADGFKKFFGIKSNQVASDSSGEPVAGSSNPSSRIGG